MYQGTFKIEIADFSYVSSERMGRMLRCSLGLVFRPDVPDAPALGAGIIGCLCFRTPDGKLAFSTPTTSFGRAKTKTTRLTPATVQKVLGLLEASPYAAQIGLGALPNTLKVEASAMDPELPVKLVAEG